MALLHVEHLWPSLFAPAPKRWGTSDGCVPGRVVWAYFAAIGTIRARIALDNRHAIDLAFGTDEAGNRARRQASDDAFPTEG